MPEIPDPPNTRACASCMSPILWLYSARTQMWVSFVTDAGSTRTLHVHGCTPHGAGRALSWRDNAPVFVAPDPAVAERVHRGRQLADAELARKAGPGGS